MLVSYMQICIIYVVKEVASLREFGQLMGVAHNRTCARIYSID